jgi:hypothetical protein
MESGQAEVAKESPWSSAKLLGKKAWGDRQRFGTIKPFAGSNPGNNERDLERRSEYIGYL